MPTNRKHGEGSIYFENSRQKWAAAFFDEDGKRHVKRFNKDCEKDARAYLIEQINDINKGSFIAPSQLSIGEWTVEFLRTYKKDSVKNTTYTLYLHLANYLQSIASVRMQDITARHIKKLYVSLQDNNNLSLHTIHKVHKLLKMVFKKAHETDLIKKNIMLAIPAPKFEKKEIEIFTNKEIDDILSTCKNHPILNKKLPMFLLAITTGMRLGELSALRWCDIDFNRSEVSIKYTLSYLPRTGLEMTTPKTKSALRKISIPIETTNTLRKLKSEVVDINIDQSTLCFRTRTGNPFNPRSIERAWADLLRCANIPYRKFHALRHTHATTLLAEGIPIVEVARRLGHAKVTHTLDLYGQFIKGYDKAISDKISSIYKL